MTGEPRGAGRLLVVCRANVCRSPTAALLLARRLPPGSGLEIGSAGWSAATGAGWCGRMRAEVADGPDAVALAAQHRPRQLDADLVGASDLVLAADLRTRAELARRAPALTARIFTVVEAAHLLAAVPGAARDATLADLITLMDARRGTVAMPAPRSSRLRRRVRAGLDLPDAHSSTRSLGHSWLVPHLDRATASLAADVVRLRGG